MAPSLNLINLENIPSLFQNEKYLDISKMPAEIRLAQFNMSLALPVTKRTHHAKAKTNFLFK